ncbi:MAG TPA: hypothetical protein VF549_21010 [Solirubrobacteraceae bacterium]|jgi:hypothetical protein
MRRHRYAVVAAAAVIAVGAAALGGSSDSEDRTTGIDERSARTAPARERDARCPKALAGAPGAVIRVVRTVRRELPRTLRGIDVRGASITSVFDLSLDAVLPGLRRQRYIRVAARACGVVVAHRSWVALVHSPRARMASLSPAVLYVARTRAGWRTWYGAYPNFGTAGFVEP